MLLLTNVPEEVFGSILQEVFIHATENNSCISLVNQTLRQWCIDYIRRLPDWLSTLVFVQLSSLKRIGSSKYLVSAEDFVFYDGLPKSVFFWGRDVFKIQPSTFYDLLCCKVHNHTLCSGALPGESMFRRHHHYIDSDEMSKRRFKRILRLNTFVVCINTQNLECVFATSLDESCNFADSVANGRILSLMKTRYSDWCMNAKKNYLLLPEYQCVVVHVNTVQFHDKYQRFVKLVSLQQHAKDLATMMMHQGFGSSADVFRQVSTCPDTIHAEAEMIRVQQGSAYRRVGYFDSDCLFGFKNIFSSTQQKFPASLCKPLKKTLYMEGDQGMIAVDVGNVGKVTFAIDASILRAFLPDNFNVAGADYDQFVSFVAERWPQFEKSFSWFRNHFCDAFAQ